MLTSEEQSDRLAAISAFTALINTESESIHARAQRAANAVRVLFGTPVTDIPTAKAAAGMVGALSNVNSPHSARAVDHVLKNAINLIGTTNNEEPNLQLSTDRARSAMIIAELAGVDKSPKFVFRFQEKLGKALWQIVWDKQRFVREQGVLGLQAILNTVIIRADQEVSKKAMARVLDNVRKTLSPTVEQSNNDAPKRNERDKLNVAAVHGTLSVVASLLSREETALYLRPVASELCTLSLCFQKSSDPSIREAVAAVLPLLVRLDGSIFEGDFLEEVHKSTLQLINSGNFPAEERGRSLVSLAATAEQIPERYNGALLEDLLVLCKQSLSAHLSRKLDSQIPRNAILKSVAHLAKTSSGNALFERYMRNGMLSQIFSTDFTGELVFAVDEIGRAVPSLVGFIRGRLVNLIAATLRSRMYDNDIALITSVHPQGDHEAKSESFLLPRQSSFSSLARSPRRAANSSSDRLVWNKKTRQPAHASSPLDFFKQYPFSAELHRIDSGVVVASDAGSCAFEGLIRSPSNSDQSSPSLSSEIPGLPSLQDDPMVDKENSPCVALKAIVTFDFSGMKAQDFTSFANEFVIGYVESQRVKVRSLAVAASATLMNSAANVWAKSRTNGKSRHRLRPEIQAILAQLLLLSVADPSRDVRFTALRSLDRGSFYPYLLQPEMLSTLFMCFHDESLAVREHSVYLAGRLSDLNPAHILPALRKYLLHLLAVLKFDGDFFVRARRDATALISALVHGAVTLVEPYTDVLMETLLIRLQESKQKNDVVSALPVLVIIADMGGVMNRIDLNSYRASLVPLIVSWVLQSQSAETAVRKAALRALASITQNTGYVIKPYSEHPDLLPGLLELLRVETDASVRLEAETLIGSLGAVNPDEHKYAAIPMYRGRRSAKGSSSGSHGRSLFKLDSQPGLLGSHRAGSGSRLLHQRGSDQKLSSAFNLYRVRQSQVNLDKRRFRDSSAQEGREPGRAAAAAQNFLFGEIDLSQHLEDPTSSISLFALGGTRLGMIAGYTPVWERQEVDDISLVGQLDHPFTASPDYYPSVALDLLHSIIGNSRLRSHHREACEAIVNVLKSVGPKCSYFLSAVVPRVLRLLAESSQHDTKQTLTFSRLQQHVMQRLGDIVMTAGYSFLPFTFDTVLLSWNFLKNIEHSPGCIASVCGLLSRLRVAIGGEFKPIIATVLPPLLIALNQDRTPHGTSAKAVLRAIESFSPLFDEYGTTVLVCLTKVISGKQSSTIREEALITIIHLLDDMPTAEVLSCTVHTLTQTLLGLNRQVPTTEDGQNDSILQSLHERRGEYVDDARLAALAATALLDIGNRSLQGFDVFVPLIAKAVKHSTIRNGNNKIYEALEKLLLSRNPEVVGDIFGSSHEDIERYKRFHGLNEDSEEANRRNMLIQELVPLRRGEFFDGQSLVSVRGPTRNTQGIISVVSEETLMQKWDVEHGFTSESWVRWIEDLGAAMLGESGSPAFRGCIRISESYPQFTKHLFNAAFLSCWVHPLSQEAKSKVCDTLEKALASETIPLNVLQSLLNLFEFMDHDEKPLPAGTERLASTACKCGAFAKAVRYREQEYSQHVGRPDKLHEDINGVDGLIAIYEKLGHIESAVGTITHYQNQTNERVKEQWFEKLQRWDDALKEYKKESQNFQEDMTEKIYQNKQKWENTLGRLRCLNETGQWQKVNDLLRETRESCEGNERALRELALEGKGVSVALDLARWDEFEEWVRYLKPNTFEGCFYRAISMIRQGKEDPEKLDEAEHFLHEARQCLDLALTARVSEGYPRAYGQIVDAQILVELQEMVSFLRTAQEDSSFGMRRLRRLWDDRLQGCKKDRYTWYRILMIRTLVRTPIEDRENWLSFATLCRKTKRLPMASQALQMLLLSHADSSKAVNDIGSGLLGTGGHESLGLDFSQSFETWDISSIVTIEDLEIKFACIKHIWATGRRHEAFVALDSCRNQYLVDAGMGGYDDLIKLKMTSAMERQETLAAEVFSKLSKWGKKLLENDDFSNDDLADPLLYAELATKIHPKWYKAWHHWAQQNATRFETMVEGRDTSIGPRIQRSQGPTYQPHAGGTYLNQTQLKHLTSAVRGYFRAIDLAGKTTLEDSLKVLTLWFNYGGLHNLHEEFDEGFRETNIAQWLEVVPQIIARLYTPFPEVQKGVKMLLTRIGTEHPHVAVYPLTVAKSTVGSHQKKRSRAASDILSELKSHHEEIVQQAELVARELVRVAILWTETWHENLEEASKLYFVQRNIEEMLDLLLPLHDELERGGDTPFERQFKAEFGEELRQAGDLCRKFKFEHLRGLANSETLRQYLNEAWVLYHNTFRKIQRKQQGMHVLDLAQVSTRLKEATGLLLAVPGTYHPDENVPVVGIQSFSARLNLIQSKQRPRKLSIIGSDGNEYQFLLKGHEDLRQDERVMQVFGLINKLFDKSDRVSILSGVGPKTYAVIALSANAGLIEWVPGCDTMHTLVKEHREVRRVMPNIELRVMLRIAPEPDRLSLLHKVDLFEFMLQNTGGTDIAKVLWLKSRNSEMWLDRRTTYAKSLATTSMIGYLLGLGDRHPSNLMIERSTGKIMHIDFGDCFEVAMKRDKYPEKIPFRLTRMLVEALEPCGVDGYFRHTAEASLDVLRQQNARESLMSMMEAFVYDPLIRWKLLGTERLVKIRHEEAVNREKRGAFTSAEADGIVGEPGGDVSDIVRSLHRTGSLQASVRASNANRSNIAGTEPMHPSAIPTPASSGRERNEDEDPANLRSVREQQRLELDKAFKEGDPAYNRITAVSNAEAQAVLSRFADKLCGTDYDPDVELSVPEQVEKLIRDAQNVENLCQLFLGWCAFW